MRHCTHQWLLQEAGWKHDQGRTTLYKLHTHWEHVRHQWCVVKKLGQILVRSWNSHPDQSKYQCTMMVWGTVLTNDCCSRRVGAMTKVWQPFTSCIHTGNMPDINDVSPKVRPDFCQILKFSPWPESQFQCTIIIRGTLSTNDCCNRLVGSITKVWQPFTNCIHTENMPDINGVSPKIGPDFCQILKFSPWPESIPVHHHHKRHCIDQWLLQ